ncbi:GNAT family N-acetyltransferase [Amycolatopsis magusensis]|uniref:GNAT family N-acetyltransferase n=1 Tax=Amycolatopsis magusensis TaxID=882444 RepID=UPI0024A976BF|nr:GNAT family N-acetyltransferase [Amycolatopsis magusensis]MDI5975766.1 GNAT family N-acetyltransferase [Amycolatopsis magusensis]
MTEATTKTRSDRLSIRLARPADLPALTGVLADREFVEDRLARQQLRAGWLLTAWWDGEAVGGMYVWRDLAEEDELREHLPGVPLLTHIEIAPGHRGRGIGTELIRHGEAQLAAAGTTRVALAVEVTNERAERLYRRLGYREWAHGLITCYAEEVLADGRRKSRPETCRVLVKPL